MKLTRIHHVQVMSPEGSGPAARHFYGEILALAETEPPATLQGPAGTWFEVGQQQLHISIDPQFSPERSRKHIALQVQDLNGLRRHLRSHSIAYQDDSRFTGYDRLYLMDPFGNRIEILEPLAEQPR